MPSDAETRDLEERLRRARDPFRSALALTLEELRGLADERERDGDTPGSEEARDLGAFGAGRIDAARFAALQVHAAPVSSEMTATLVRAQEALHVVAQGLDGLCTIRIEPGADLRDEVARALARIGRAFAAARAVARMRTTSGTEEGAPASPGARSDARSDEQPAAPAASLAFGAWTRAERDLAPPLLVRLTGADLQADGLAAFLDGRVRFVLLVEGPAPPAPLVRLVSPGCFVMQTGDPAELARVLDAPGPGIAAYLPEGAARFVHDPRAGARLDQRLRVDALPERPPTTSLGPRSARQQADELLQLGALATAGSSAARPDGAAPADVLAAWLLTQADLRDL